MVNKSIHFSKKGILTFLVFLACTSLVPFSSRYIQKFRFLNNERILYVPPGEYLELLRGGFRGFLSDMYYIRGVLSITDEFKTQKEMVWWVQENLRAAVSLDPDLTQAYFFGGVVIANDKESIQKGIEFLHLGLRLSPRVWEIHYWIGFDYFLLRDYLKAAQYYQSASRFSDAPNFLKSNQEMLYYQAGRAQMGILYLEGLLRSVKDEKQLEWIKLKLEWLKNIVLLEEKVSQFKIRFGRSPQDLDELVSSGLLNNIPDDPFGKGYYFDGKNQAVKSAFEFVPKKKGENPQIEMNPLPPESSASQSSRSMPSPKGEPKKANCPNCKE